MLVVSRFTDPAPDFPDRARRALEVLAARPGFRGGRLGRAADDPARWLLVTEWDGAGPWRRALGAYDVRVEVVPLFAAAADEPSAFEVLHAVDPAPARPADGEANGRG
jgi:hypothetical protein